MPYDQKAVEAEVLRFWEDGKIPQRLAGQRTRGKKFFLLDGPPYANALPHVGHVKTTAFKDIWSRFMQMEGHTAYFQAGFDCHGLPTEVMVEKELGIKSKKDIEAIGIEKFDAACLAKVTNTEKAWMEYYRLLGAWRYYAEPYFTYQDYYIESGWWTVKRMHEKGLLAPGEKSVYWCPHCETSLSGYEVSDSYKDLEDSSVYVKFAIKGAKDEYLLVWTTTPWTLPSNAAIVILPEEMYVKAKVGGEHYWLAEKLADAVLKGKAGKDYEIVKKAKGAELDGMEYEPLLDIPAQKSLGRGARRVYLSIPILTNKKYKKHSLKHAKTEAEKKSDEVAGTVEREEYEEFVTVTDGTGLVHCAPGHGQTDHYVGKFYSIPFVSPVDEQGRFTDQVPEWKGQRVRDANDAIAAKLKAEGKMFFGEKIVHRAALCWRCKTPLVFRVSRQWYLKVDPLKETMLKENQRHVRWMPEYGKVKFHNWLVDREDWCISQQRYWGIPLPIWECADCGKIEVIGSRDELEEKSVGKLAAGDLKDLHRHAVDGIEIECGGCGSPAKRVKDILNVWFDSGIAPWASFGYPFKNKELFEGLFPADLVCESQDQIRGWFDSLMFASVGAFGKSSYQAVGLMGWVLDEKGDKMSKSLGNVVPAKEAIAKLSADVIRMYYCYEIAPWEVQKFSFKTAEEVRRAFAIFYNSYLFWQTYAGGPSPTAGSMQAQPIAGKTELSALKLAPEDEWILSRLATTAAKVRQNFSSFEFHLAGRALLNFAVEDLSRAYIKLIRDRVSTGAQADSHAALAVLRHCLAEFCKLVAPISPFVSEFVFQQVKTEAAESVHYCDYPSPDASFQNPRLEETFSMALAITEAVNSARQEAALKKRWPLAEVVVAGDGRVAVEDLQDVLCRLCNAQKVSFAKSEPEGMVSKDFRGGKAFISKTMDESLLKEAFFREFSRAIQSARKAAGLVVHDGIALSVHASPEVKPFLEESAERLKRDVGASKVEFAESDAGLKGDASAEAELEALKAKARFSKT
ncbi:MAG: isoleucine--tRNA ligase [Candidatus Micrarchaeota archaeon]